MSCGSGLEATFSPVFGAPVGNWQIWMWVPDLQLVHWWSCNKSSALHLSFLISKIQIMQLKFYFTQANTQSKRKSYSSNGATRDAPSKTWVCFLSLPQTSHGTSGELLYHFIFSCKMKIIIFSFSWCLLGSLVLVLHQLEEMWRSQILLEFTNTNELGLFGEEAGLHPKGCRGAWQA